MAVRRLAETQPESFAFTADNVAWAEREIAKYPEGRQASAVIALLWRAQEQEGWVSEPAIRTVAEMLDMPRIRVLEIATFYTMFQLEPVGSIAHIQVCGTTPCWLRGADDLKAVCRSRINAAPHRLSDDKAFSWEEVECLGACVNAPMVQIGADTYEDLTTESFEKLIDDLAAGRPVKPGPQIDRQFSAPLGGPTSLKADPTVPVAAPSEPETQDAETGETAAEPESAALPPKPQSSTSAIADTSQGGIEKPADGEPASEAADDAVAAGTDNVVSPARALDDAEREKVEAPSPPPELKAADTVSEPPPPADSETAPGAIAGARNGEPDDLKRIKGIGPKIEGILHDLGIYHFDQIAAWTEADAAWVDARLQFKGRIDREGWIEQARAFAGEDGAN